MSGLVYWIIGWVWLCIGLMDLVIQLVYKFGEPINHVRLGILVNWVGLVVYWLGGFGDLASLRVWWAN